MHYLLPIPQWDLIKAKPFMHRGLDFLGPWACK
uniref:Oxidoreductase n=1 Tax=Heterorhabditis bacteriophora TaxID=37862 RepID=A0A1I7WF62_HETBA